MWIKWKRRAELDTARAVSGSGCDRWKGLCATGTWVSMFAAWWGLISATLDEVAPCSRCRTFCHLALICLRMQFHSWLKAAMLPPPPLFQSCIPDAFLVSALVVAQPHRTCPFHSRMSLGQPKPTMKPSPSIPARANTNQG